MNTEELLAAKDPGIFSDVGDQTELVGERILDLVGWLDTRLQMNVWNVRTLLRVCLMYKYVTVCHMNIKEKMCHCCVLLVVLPPSNQKKK